MSQTALVHITTLLQTHLMQALSSMCVTSLVPWAVSQSLTCHTPSPDTLFLLLSLHTHTGTVKYAYHKFGPLGDVTESDLPQFSGEAKKTAPSPVVFISGWGTSMYIWPIPVSGQQCFIGVGFYGGWALHEG
jgi:hypothetical protein